MWMPVHQGGSAPRPNADQHEFPPSQYTQYLAELRVYANQTFHREVFFDILPSV